MKLIFRKIWTAAAIVLLAMPLAANNITVSNVAITARDDANKFIEVTFNITWENSFRTVGLSPNNWDAAWVFMKFNKTNSYSAFDHCKLDAVANHSLPDADNYEFVQPADSMGVFIQRKTPGSGTVTLNGCKLRWKYSGSASFDPTNPIDVKVFALEMVYVPTGAFKVGSGGAESGAFGTGASLSTPFPITSEASLSINNAAGALWGSSSSGNNTIGAVGTLPAEFPKGYQGFYCMKYELTQKAYVDFLNSLSRRQQNYRTNLWWRNANGNGGIMGNNPSYYDGTWYYNFRYVMSIDQASRNYQNGIRCLDNFATRPAPIVFANDVNGSVAADFSSSNQADDGQQKACGYLSNASTLAYLDWSGLRPMSELEYEKACRGNATPLANEYVWGTTNYVSLTSPSNNGMVNEVAVNPAANCNVDGNYNAVLRVGMFANPASSRAESGATFWGIQNMGDNLWEPCMSVGLTDNRFFTSTLHGDGKLTVMGATDTGWPNPGMRGGSAANAVACSRTSDRVNASYVNTSWNVWNYGCRGVRTAP